MSSIISTKDLAVGYNRKILIQGINIRLEPGRILTLIGPNGAGKSTILKTITRQLAAVSGSVFIGDQPVTAITAKDFARKSAVVLTERIHPELMSCWEVTAMGRYPYTDMFGKLTDHDKEVVNRSLEQVHALSLADQDFTTLSDGQRQRIMLARAICQEPEIIVLDEPTAYLDIRYKVELLNILRQMATEQKTTIIMSLHEIDLAMKISDDLLCLDGEKITAYGPPDSVLTADRIGELFGIRSGSYNLLSGSVEFPAPAGDPEVFIVAGNGKGTPFYRSLQKQGTPFATGILFENDVDFQTARVLSDHVIKAPAFGSITPELIDEARQIIRGCAYVLDAGTEIGPQNRANAGLLTYAAELHIPVCKDIRKDR